MLSEREREREREREGERERERERERKHGLNIVIRMLSDCHIRPQTKNVIAASHVLFAVKQLEENPSLEVLL